MALRFGLFYGPEVASTLALARRLRRRQVFVPAGATGVGSFVHVDDAAAATMATLESASPGGVYNVVDDEPMAFSAYLELFARLLVAPPPRRAPAWLVRLLAPIPAGAAFTRLSLSNARARSELRWRPLYATLCEGLPHGGGRPAGRGGVIAAAEYEDLRPYLFSIAHRMLG